ncbi:P2X purinoceptor 7-like [Acanthopagrus latus]|uniref:P2X purinoceptor 7-like n=1 Tax=Acanthopagrus latus TaxID=8177 RepID=UPI00187BFCB3|nr:P2X purinoceptor 7-like [Acanthopagrus latus]
MAMAELPKEMAAGQQTAVQPYMFEPESDPEQQEAPEEVQQPRMNMDVSQWCSCGSCEQVPTEPENICCIEIPQVTRRLSYSSFLSNHHAWWTTMHGLEPVCLNVFSLQNALNIYRADYGPLRLRGIVHQYRYLACRSFVSWCWCFLGRRVRAVLPACVVLRIHAEFPDAEIQYVRFSPVLD